ncbi:MAG: 2-oxo acid dehydrogenase subunit E2 [Planctomycetota bacterium]
MIEFKLPDIGEGVAEGEIVKWLVAEGAVVEEHQSLVEVMTDKATVEIPAPAAGKVTRLLAAEGDTIPVGQVIFHLEPADAPVAVGASGSSASGSSASAGAPPPAPSEALAPAPVAKAAPAVPASTGGRTLEFRLPDVGEGIAEGEIVRWLVTEGTVVEEHQGLVEVMTDKATVEVPSPAAGTVTRLLVAAGATVPVGDVIFHLEIASDSAAAPAAATPQAAPVGGQPLEQAAAQSNGHATSKVLAVPSARRVARELNIDLSRVSGSGRNGVIRRADVEAFAADPERAAPARTTTPTAAAPSAASQGTREEVRTPFRGIRRKISDAMVRSVSTAAHFTVVEEVDVTQLVTLRQKAKVIGAEQGVKVTYMPFIMKAAALGLARYPSLNGHLDEEAQEIVNPLYVHLGIAVDTQNGLVVPVIQDVQAKAMLQLARELEGLGERAREGRLKLDELRGSTFTITNAGNIGGILATPIINFPDIAILGVHRIVKRPGVVETPAGDEIAVRHYMNLSCSVDHRLADGADAARFLVHLKTLLEEPGLLAL